LLEDVSKCGGIWTAFPTPAVPPVKTLFPRGPFPRMSPRRRFRSFLLAIFTAVFILLPCERNAAQQPPAVKTTAVPIKVLRYAQALVDKYDADGDRKLTADEYREMQGNPEDVDTDQDGAITVDEMARHVARYGQGRRIRLMPSAAEYLIRFRSGLDLAAGPAEAHSGAAEEIPTGTAEEPEGASKKSSYKRFYVPPARLPAGLPKWFEMRDQDGDMQLTFAEFAPKPTSQQRQEFAEYDANRDGLITAWEMMGVPARPRPRREPPEPPPAEVSQEPELPSDAEETASAETGSEEE
jgi:hypothetical protein